MTLFVLHYTPLIISDIDECLNVPCLHNGSCSNTDGSYTCSCVPQWTGNDCEIGKLVYQTELSFKLMACTVLLDQLSFTGICILNSFDDICLNINGAFQHLSNYRYWAPEINPLT